MLQKPSNLFNQEDSQSALFVKTVLSVWHIMWNLIWPANFIMVVKIKTFCSLYWNPYRYMIWLMIPSGSDSEESACSAGDLGLILGWERSPWEVNGTHSSTLAWRATVCGMVKSWTRLSMHKLRWNINQLPRSL